MRDEVWIQYIIITFKTTSTVLQQTSISRNGSLRVYQQSRALYARLIQDK